MLRVDRKGRASIAFRQMPATGFYVRYALGVILILCGILYLEMLDSCAPDQCDLSTFYHERIVRLLR